MLDKLFGDYDRNAFPIGTSVSLITRLGTIFQRRCSSRALGNFRRDDAPSRPSLGYPFVQGRKGFPRGNILQAFKSHLLYHGLLWKAQQRLRPVSHQKDPMRSSPPSLFPMHPGKAGLPRISGSTIINVSRREQISRTQSQGGGGLLC